jgi:hypothetical protein
VDNDVTTREHQGSCTVLQREVPTARLSSLRSTAEAITWLRGLPSPASGATRRALVISSRFRQNDGGDQAAAQLVKAMRGDKSGKEVPVMIYCGNKAKVQDLTEKDGLVKAADQFTEVIAFVKATALAVS